jgi:hypothetical protein
LRNLYRREPLQFVKAIINALPSHVEFASVASQLSDEEIAAHLEQLRQTLTAPKPVVLLEAKKRDETTIN